MYKSNNRLKRKKITMIVIIRREKIRSSAEQCVFVAECVSVSAVICENNTTEIEETITTRIRT